MCVGRDVDFVSLIVLTIVYKSIETNMINEHRDWYRKLFVFVLPLPGVVVVCTCLSEVSFFLSKANCVYMRAK